MSTDTRTRILEATIELLGREGADGFTASRLAREVGVSKATLFHHFSALDEIPLAALDVFSQQMLEAAVPSTSSLDELLAALAEMTVRLLEERRGFVKAYFVFFAKAMFDERLKARLRTSLELIKAGFHQLFVECGLSPEQAARYSYLTLLLLDGAALHLQVVEDSTEIRQAWQGYRQLLQEVQP